MRVCSKCGMPDNGSGICTNCKSTAFKVIGAQNNSSQNQFGGNSSNPNYYGQQPSSRYDNDDTVPLNGLQFNPHRQSNAAAYAGAAAAGAAAGSKSAVKIVIPIIVAVIAVLAAVIVPVAVTSNSSTPQKTLNQFVAAYNKLDINEMMECFESDVRDAYKAGDDLFGGALGFSYQSAADMLPFLSGAMGMDEEMPKLEIDVVNVNETGSNTCMVDVILKMSMDGETDTEEDSLEMVKEDGKWYLSSELFYEMF